MLKSQYTTKSGFSDSSIWFFLYILCCLVQYLHELLRELFMVTVSTSSCIASIVFIISVRQRIIKRYLTSPPDSIQQTNMGLLAFQIVCLEFSAEVFRSHRLCTSSIENTQWSGWLRIFPSSWCLVKVRNSMLINFCWRRLLACSWLLSSSDPK